MDPVPDEPVHVLHVIPGLLAGGMELTMAKVIRGLNSGCMRHTVVALKDELQITDLLPSDTGIHSLHAKPNELRLPLRLARIIRETRPTVIHARNWGAWPDTVVAGLIVRPRIPVVLSFHGLGRAGYMPLRRRMASWGLARMCTALFTVSNRSKELLISKWGWPRETTEVIPNGVDTDRFAPVGRGIQKSRLIVGAVGNLRPVKNHALLVRACADLVQDGKDLELRIAGEGEERDNLTRLAHEARMGDRLKLCGRVDNIPGFLNELDLFVLSSDSEQHPNALNEAMACGLACVATRVGCVDELLDQGRCGRIVAPGRQVEMAQAIRDLIDSPSMRDRFARLARERACEHYSLPKMLAAYEALYRRCSRAGKNTH